MSEEANSPSRAVLISNARSHKLLGRTHLGRLYASDFSVEAYLVQEEHEQRGQDSLQELPQESEVTSLSFWQLSRQ
jgi:hypothetical protein